MSNNADMERLMRSLEDSSKYPQNLMRTEEFPYSLVRYQGELESLKDKIFKASDGAFIIWDLNPDKNGAGFRYTENPVKELEGLNDVVGGSKPDPLKRFFFLRSRSSRSHLECSKRQMEAILSYHQVMAPFLDHVISFRKREDAHKFASFTNEDYLSSHHSLPGLAGLQRSGIQLQQCFNVLGMEYDEDDDPKWKQRQVAAHHSFDLQNGRSTWIVMKGDGTIRERMQEATRASLTQQPEFPASLASSMRESLREHLIILQWGSENWTQYINCFEEECNEASKVTGFKKIDDLANDIFARKVRARRASSMSKPTLPRTPDSLPQISEKEGAAATDDAPATPGLLRRISSRFTSSSTFPLMKGVSQRTAVESTEIVNENLDLAALTKFQRVQKLNQLAKDILAATSVIDQNKRVFGDIRTRYQELIKSPLFDLHVSDMNTKRSCEKHVADFARKVQRLESDLDSHQIRLRTILYRIEQASEMYNRMFQVVNTRTAEYFARTSQNSTELMQEWTEQMHQKTMSMHIITIFTLIFLPGTFVATMFSSGIVTFGQEGEGGFGPFMGDWKVRPAGIKLFFAICVPLLFMTLCAWTVAYCTAKIRATNRRNLQDAMANGEP